MLSEVLAWFHRGPVRAVTCVLTLALGFTFTSLRVAAVAAKVEVVASTNDLASIAATVGGDRVEVKAIARPGSDAHRVEVLPSYMVRVAKANLYFKVGLGLDPWADAIIDGSRNARLAIVDCSRGSRSATSRRGKSTLPWAMSIPPATRTTGWIRGTAASSRARWPWRCPGRIPPAPGEYEARAAAFAVACDSTYARARTRLAGLASRTLITYHDSWVYFAGAFDLEIVARVEPKPGIPPTGRHLDDLVGIIRERQVPVLV